MKNSLAPDYKTSMVADGAVGLFGVACGAVYVRYGTDLVRLPLDGSDETRYPGYPIDATFCVDSYTGEVHLISRDEPYFAVSPDLSQCLTAENPDTGDRYAIDGGKVTKNAAALDGCGDIDAAYIYFHDDRLFIFAADGTVYYYSEPMRRPSPILTHDADKCAPCAFVFCRQSLMVSYASGGTYAVFLEQPEHIDPAREYTQVLSDVDSADRLAVDRERRYLISDSAVTMYRYPFSPEAMELPFMEPGDRIAGFEPTYGGVYIRIYRSGSELMWFMGEDGNIITY